MTGIIGAMSIEIENLNAAMENKEIKTVSGIEFTKGTLCGQEVVTAVCGIGKVFAAMCAQTMIMLYSPDRIINTGVAGSLSSSLGIGDIAVSDYVVQHDMDTSPLGDPVGMISKINLVNIPADESLAQKITNSAQSVGNIKSIIGTIASGDCFVNDAARKKYISSTFGAVACEMEGAAIGHVCYVNSVPFCVIRAISDNADGSSHMDYAEFTKLAAENSISVLKNLLSSEK
ncbi:MAG: 5'-methylthioadenosine/adenosylhomocysteine nucleosidase [Clostridia bacterium]|nr:5'-methylthioadenosine/adenosylhomocysteine nucleosidase [Clostridia bacterium]